MPVITCPQCGRVRDLPEINRTADEFCQDEKCDFPLFWASAATATDAEFDDSDASMRRLPGTGGKRTVGAKACPHCGEHNPLTGTHCTRCGEALVVAAAELRGEYLATPEPYAEQRMRDYRLAMWLLVALVAVLITLAVLFAVDVL